MSDPYAFGAADMQRMRMEFSVGLAMRDVTVVRERRGDAQAWAAGAYVTMAHDARGPRQFFRCLWTSIRYAFLSGVHDARGTVDERTIANTRMHAKITGITT